MRGSTRASVTEYRKQTGYYGFCISCCHDCMILEHSRTLSISVHSPTQVPQMKPIVTLLVTRHFRIEGADQTARVLISVTQLTRNGFQQKRLEGDL